MSSLPLARKEPFRETLPDQLLPAIRCGLGAIPAAGPPLRVRRLDTLRAAFLRNLFTITRKRGGVNKQRLIPDPIFTISRVAPLFTPSQVSAHRYGTVNVPPFCTADVFASPLTGCRNPWLLCVISADQTAFVPEAGGARNPGTPERSGNASLVDPFRKFAEAIT